MKNVKKLASALLVLVMVLSLCACGGAEKALVGTWKYDCDLSVMIEDRIEAGLGEDLEVGTDLIIPIILTFNDDKTVVLTYDTDVARDSFTAYLDALTGALVEIVYGQAEASGLSREDFDVAFEEMYGMSVQDFCVETMNSSVDVDALIGSMDEEFKGVFKVEDNKLFIEDTEDDYSEDRYLEFTVEGETLEFVKNVGNAIELDELMPEYPMVFEKQ